MPHSWVNCRPPGSPFRGMLEVGSVEAQERRPTCRRRAGYNRVPTAEAGKPAAIAAGFFAVFWPGALRAGPQLVEEGKAFFDKGARTPLRASVVRQRRTIRHSAPREVFSATYTPPPKMIAIYFAAAAAKLCEAFLTGCAGPFLRPRNTRPRNRRSPWAPSRRRCPLRPR